MSDAEYLRMWRKQNPEKCAGYRAKAKASGSDKEWYNHNKAKKIEKVIQWRRDNSEKFREYKREHYAQNKEHILELQASPKYREKTNARNAKYRADNPDKFRAKSKAWRAKYPDRARISDANKKAMRKRAEGRFTLQDIEKLIVLQKSKCVYCVKKINTGYHIDHIQPLSKGGSNWPSNLQLLCGACNMSKHNADPIIFAQKNGRLL